MSALLTADTTAILLIDILVAHSGLSIADAHFVPEEATVCVTVIFSLPFKILNTK